MVDGAGGEVQEVVPEDRPVRATGVASAELDGEVILLDATGYVHLLNPTAALLWACFDGRETIEEIAAEAASAFDVRYDAMLADLCAFANEMAALGLVAAGPGLP